MCIMFNAFWKSSHLAFNIMMFRFRHQIGKELYGQSGRIISRSCEKTFLNEFPMKGNSSCSLEFQAVTLKANYSA